MKKMIKVFLVLVLMFLGARTGLFNDVLVQAMDAVKVFLRSQTSTVLIGYEAEDEDEFVEDESEYEESEDNQTDFDDSDEYVDEISNDEFFDDEYDDEHVMFVSVRGSVTYELGYDPSAEEVVADAWFGELDQNIYLTQALDVSFVDFYAPGFYEVVGYGVSEDGTYEAEIIVELFVIDQTPPIINGNEYVVYNIDDEITEEIVLADLGIVVTDDSGEFIEPAVDFSAVDFTTPGTYVVSVYAADSSGNATLFDVNVELLPSVLLSIELINDHLFYEIGTNVDEAMIIRDSGLFVASRFDFTVTSNIDTIDANFASIGTYVISFTAIDSTGDEQTVEVMVDIVPFIVIDMKFDSVVRGASQAPLSEQEFLDVIGFTATDDAGNAITPIVELSGVNWNTPGTYEAIIGVQDPATREPEARRIPVMIQAEASGVTISSNQTEITYEIGAVPADEQIWNDLGVTVTAESPDIEFTETRATDGLDRTAVGDYTITVHVETNTGETEDAQFVVHVVDTTPPVVEITTNTLEYPFGTPKTGEEVLADAGVTVTDNSGETIDPQIDISGVDWNTLGTYNATITATDSAGNTTTETITINVIDNTPPRITMSTREQTVEVGEPKTAEEVLADSNVRVTDDSGETIEPQIDISGVNWNMVGDYNVPVTATDSSGNTTTDNIIIHVTDSSPPSIRTTKNEETYEIHTRKTPEEVMADLGTRIVDNSGETIIPRMDLSNVDFDRLGDYRAEISATDSSGNTSSRQMTIHIVDTTPPEITGDDAKEYELGTNVTPQRILQDANIQVTDNSGETVTPQVNMSQLNVNKPGTYPVDVTAMDGSGNTTTKTIQVTIIDVTPPVITTNSEHTYEIHTPKTEAEVLADLGVSVTDDSGETITPQIDISGVDFNTLGDYEATITATDSSGNTSTEKVTIHVVDTIPPVITGDDTKDYPLGTSLTGEQVLQDFNIQVTDNSGETITPQINMSGVDTNKPGKYPVDITATDSSGNTSTKTIEIEIIDSTPPVVEIANPEQTYEVGTPKTEAEVLADLGVTVTDDSGEEITPEIDLSGVDFNKIGDYQAEVKATDSSGNTTTEQVTIHVVDTTPPVIEGEETDDYPIGTALTEQQLLQDLKIQVTDNSGETITPQIDMSQVDVNRQGRYPVVITATDSSGNTSTRTIEIGIGDTTPPVITSDETKEYPIGTSLTPEQVIQDYNVEVTDNSGEDITPQIDVSQVDSSKPGKYPVEITATDSAGNTSTKTIEVEIKDTTPPVVDITNREQTYEVGTPKTEAEVLADLGVSVTDDSGEEITPEIDLSGVDFNKIGDYEAEVKATDSAGNTTTEKVTIHVVDTTPPVINGDETKDYPVGTTLTDAQVLQDLNIAVTDNSGETITPQIDLSGVDTSKPGKYPVEITATDSSGNTSTKTVEIEIKDITPPVVEIANPEQTYEVGTPKTEAEVLADLGVSVTDDSGETITPEIDLSGVDFNTIGDYEAEVKATDSAGNTTTEKVTIHVVDTTPPDIAGDEEKTYPIGTTLTNEQVLQDLNISVTDNSGENITPEIDLSGVDTSKPGKYPVEITATDSSGNTSTKTVEITVEDTTPPVVEIANPEQTYEVGTPKTEQEVLNDLGITVTDDSGETITPEIDLSGVDFNKIGDYEAEVKATDSSGNTTTEKVTIHVVDTTPPDIAGDEAKTYPVGTTLTDAQVLQDLNISVTDNSGETITPQIDLSQVDASKPGKYPAEITATDSSGNTSTKTVEITIEDTTPPVLEIPEKEKTYEVGTPKTAEEVLADLNVTVTDDSGETITPEIDLSGVDFNKIGDYEAEVKATDSSGNTTTEKVTIHVVDTTPPVINGDEAKGYPVGTTLTDAQVLQDLNISVSDNSGETITPQIDISGVDTSTPGKYPVEITATDSSGNTSTKTVEIEIGDDVPPVVEIANPEQTYEVGTPKTEAEVLADLGVTVTDNSGETITPEIDLSGVDFNTIGDYEAEVKATDSSGNTTTQKVTIHVVDTTPPAIAGDEAKTYPIGTTLTNEQVLQDLNINVTDNSGETITPQIDVSSVDTSKPGTYPVEITATDSSGNTSTKTVQITVEDTTPPVVDITNREQTYEVGTPKTEAEVLADLGVTVTDNSGETITPEIDLSGVDFNKIGDYEAEVKATDSSGNTTTEKVTIHVVDTTPPDIAGDEAKTYPVGTTLTNAQVLQDLNISVTDNSGETITPQMDLSGVDTSKPGTYPVEITATDSSGNTSTKTIEITIEDTTPPVIEIPEKEKTYEVGTPKTAEEVLADLNVTVTDDSGETITPEIDLSGVDFNTIGDYEAEVKATDSSGNTTTEKVTIHVVDTTPPVINGDETKGYPVGTTLTEAQVLQDLNIEVTDNSGETITPQVDMSQVDTSTPGKYPVTITATDSSGNTTTKTVEIEIGDDTPPVMDIPEKEKTYEVGTPKTEQEVLNDLNITVTDDSGETITPEIDLSGVDFNTIGDYEAEVKATDSSGNTTTEKVTIHVTDTTPPVINGDETKDYPLGTTLTPEQIIQDMNIGVTDSRDYSNR